LVESIVQFGIDDARRRVSATHLKVRSVKSQEFVACLEDCHGKVESQDRHLDSLPNQTNFSPSKSGSRTIIL
jgi:hypothetical protein